jgi:hypothetical protein
MGDAGLEAQKTACADRIEMRYKANGELIEPCREWSREFEQVTSALALKTGPTPAKLAGSRASCVASLDKSCIPTAWNFLISQAIKAGFTTAGLLFSSSARVRSENANPNPANSCINLQKEKKATEYDDFVDVWTCEVPRCLSRCLSKFCKFPTRVCAQSF